MNNAGALTPPTVPPAPTWWRQHRVPVVATGLAIGVGALSVSAALVLLAKPMATVETMVPATADVMVLANLDPSVAQKVNFARALHRFPDTKTDLAITSTLEDALKVTGLSYRADLQPWLGGELGASAKLNDDSSADTAVTLYFVSRDDAKAKAFLAKLRTLAPGKTMQWQDETYGGLTISVGTPSQSTGKPAAYTYVNHVAVMATSRAMVKEAIDTAQGRTPRLIDSPAYKATIGSLPSDRVGLAFVNGISLVAGIKKQLAKAPSASKPIVGNVRDLDAFVGIGATLSAAGNGIQADLVVKLDQSKLSPATREAFSHAGHADGVISWIPGQSDGFVAVGDLNRTMQTLVDASTSDPSISASTNAFGLTGPGGVLPHLTGDAALEAQVGSKAGPAGALLLRSDDARSLSAFFSKLLTLASSSGSVLTPGLSATQRQPAIAAGATTTYRGVLITSRSALPGLTGLAPSYAVLDGMGILGSNLAAVEAVIDTHKGGPSMANEPTYRAAAGASIARPSAVFFVKTGSLLQAARQLKVPGATRTVDGQTVATLEPIKALSLTSTSQADQLVERLFLLIE
ncbi:MAG: DUF3352 domain-containing protein [Candidatus Dormibacter sp.]